MKKLIIPMFFALSLSIWSCRSIPEKVYIPDTDISGQLSEKESETSEKMNFWNSPKKGANYLPSNYNSEYFKAAADAGIQYIRLGPNLLPADDKDFLIGDLDNYQAINKTDLEVLLDILDDAEKSGIAVILTMFELPGHKYGNPNEEETDCRLWNDQEYWVQSFEFWKDLAAAVKDHPAVAAYNPVNEPVAAYAFGFDEPDSSFRRWLKASEGTTADLNLFNKMIVKAIREADSNTPILLDGYLWADPKGMPYTVPVDDPYILYSFHNPAPWNFSSLSGNMGRYSYPDAMPAYWNGPQETWDINRLAELLKPVEKFAEENGIPSNRIIAAEFWCNRRIAGCAEYLNDLIHLYNRHEWHWSFWSYRCGGTFTAYEYELGDAPDSGEFIVKTRKGAQKPEDLYIYTDNRSWRVLSAALNNTEPVFSDLVPQPSSASELAGLISNLRDEEWIVRDRSALLLAESGPYAAEAVPELIRLLDDEEWIVRRSAVYALSKIAAFDDEQVWNEVEKLRNDEEDAVRVQAALALGLRKAGL